MNEVSDSLNRRDWPESETVRSWGNHFFKGMPWQIAVVMLSGAGARADRISIKINWPVLG